MATLLEMTVALSLAVPVLSGAAFAGSPDDPVAVLDARQAAFNVRNLDAAMAFFADEATVTMLVGTPRQTQYVGRDQIRRWQETLLKNQSVRVESVGERTVTGDTVTWTAMVSRDEWNRIGIDALRLWGEAVVREGKIVSLRNGLTLEAAEKLRAAVAKQKGER